MRDTSASNVCSSGAPPPPGAATSARPPAPGGGPPKGTAPRPGAGKAGLRAVQAAHTIGHAELAQRLRSNSKDFFDFKADNLLTAGKRAPTPEPEPESQPEPEAEPDVFGPALGKWKIEEEEVHVVTENERVWSTVASLQRTVEVLRIGLEGAARP